MTYQQHPSIVESYILNEIVEWITQLQTDLNIMMEVSFGEKDRHGARIVGDNSLQRTLSRASSQAEQDCAEYKKIYEHDRPTRTTGTFSTSYNLLRHALMLSSGKWFSPSKNHYQ